MGAGWIAQGADSPAPAAGADTAQPGAAVAPSDPWKPSAPDTASVPSLVRPHQADHPVEGSLGLFKRVKDAIGGTAEDPSTPLGAVVDWGKNRALAPGPSTATLASAYPHLVGAQFTKLKAGAEEITGAKQVQSAERQLAAHNVLPQVAARYTPPGGLPDYDKIAADPLVKNTAIKLGISPGTFAHDYNTIAASSNEANADTAARAKQMLDAGKQNNVAAQQDRAQAWADERAWQPSDLTNGKLDPMSLKGLAFNTALAIPALAAVGGAAAAGTAATGNPVGGIAAGGATAVALFAPQQHADIKDKIDDQVSTLLQKADALDDAAPIGGKRGLNPVTEQIRQQAADLNANSDNIANTAGLLYAVSDAVGAVPVSAVLSKSPAGKAMLDRMLGAATQKYVGGRIAGAMVANGAGGMLQATIQKAVDTGIVHEQTSLSDALKDIAYTGITSALTAAPIAAAHEAIGAPGRAQAKRDLDSDELLSRVKAASAKMGAANGETGEEYPGYKWNEATKRYESTGTRGPSSSPRVEGSVAPDAEAPGAPGPGGSRGDAGGGAANAPGTEAPTGAAGARAAFKAKTDTLNAAAAAAQKRSDVTLEPEEEGWSVHVKGQPVARFDTVEAAREAMAQARKVVGTKPAAAATNEASGETEAPIGATKAPSGETTSASAPSNEAPKAEVVPETAQPEDPLERTQPVQVERRTHGEMRQRVDQMNPEQMKAALLTHELTGIPNRRAYEDAPKKPAQVSVDVDSLKWLNDTAGHESGDQLLKAVAQAMHEETGGNAYHISGDEFVAQGDSHAEAEAAMARVRSRLAEAKLTFAHPDGRTITLSGIGVSHGTGTTLEAAERNLGQAKSGREQRGLRAARGEQPPNARIEPGQSGVSSGGGAAAAPGTEVLGQKVKPPQKPTVLQSGAGNYFKPTVHWNGLPIKVENVKGQHRRYLDAKTGKPGRRLMKADYGYFPGTKGNDEDGIDVMMGPHHDSDKAFVIDQLNHSGKAFDEHKVQLGVRTEAEARQQYLAHYPVDWKGLGAITELDPAQLKRWLKEGDLTKPISPDAVPVAKPARGATPNNRHDSILQYLARHPRGLDSQEAESQGIDKADMSLAAAHVGIKRAFRKGGMTFDEAAEHLHESGYRVANKQGHYDPNVLLDKLSDELRGRPHYSVHNETESEKEHLHDWRTPLTDEQLRKLSVDEAQVRLEQLRQEQERLEREIERAGLAGEDAPVDDLENSIVFQRSRPARGKPPGVQQDLFGAVDHVKSEIKRLEAELDKKRNSGQESVETGRPDDLFSQARQQTDLTDKPIGHQEDLASAADEDWTPLEPADLLQRSIPEVRDYIAGAKAGGHAAEVKEGERVLAIHVEQARVEREFAEQRPVTAYGKSLLERVAAVEKTLGIKGGALEDAGEKIGGARKDKWAERGMRLSDLSGISEAEAAELVTKKAVFNPDWQKIVAGGMDPKTAALGKILIDQLAARPRLNTPEGRRHYVEVLGRVRDMILEAKKPDDLRGLQMRLAQELGMPTGYAIASTPEQKTARDKFWSIQKGRRSTLQVAHSDVRKADAMLAKGWPAKAIKEAPGPATDKPKEKELPSRPHLDFIDRVGPPVRTGDVTSSDFIKDFGFRGLEFGNWAASDERQKLLNHAYEGMHDLARVLDLPPRALSLNGTMGLALGARGGGRFAAHYESGKMVINMTKINGAGALAHEWGHALDHYMGEYGRADAYTTDPRGATGWRTDRRSLSNLRPEMQAAWEGVMAAMYKKQQPAAEFIRDHEIQLERLKSQGDEVAEAMKERPGDTNLPPRREWIARRVTAAQEFLEELRANPQASYSAGPSAYVKEAAGLGDYWRRPTEMFARAFEGFVEDKIHAAGGKSEYLVHHAAGLGYPAEDRPAINAAIQHLVDTLETREEGGKTVLYRRGDGTVSRSMSAPAVQSAADKFLAGFKVKPKLVIVKDLAEIQNGTDSDLAFHLAGYEPGDVTAFLKPSTGEIYLIADQFHSPADVAATLAHEYVGHFGLRALYGEKGYQAILDGVNAAMPAEVRIHGQREYGDSYNHFNPEQRARAAEEVLTYYSQRYTNDQSIPAQMKRWVEKFLGAIRDWIRKVLGLPQKFDALFVKRTLADLESFLRRGNTGSDATVTSAASATRAGPAFAAKQDTFFSGLAKAVDAAKRDKGTGAEWEATLKNMPGVKAEEMQWTGLKDWLEGRGRVSKQEVADYVAAHRVQVGEVVRGEDRGSQVGLDDDDIDTINKRRLDAGMDELSEAQADALRAGGPEAEAELGYMSNDLNVDVDDFVQRSPAASEAIIRELHDMGFQVHEDEVTGQPYVMQVDDRGVATEVADGDIPPVALDLLDQLRKGDRAPPKYPQHVTPGGTNYRELLLTLGDHGASQAAKEALDRAVQARLRAETELHAARKAAWEVMDAKRHGFKFSEFTDALYRASSSDSAEAMRGKRLASAMVEPQGPAFKQAAAEAVHKAIEAGRVMRQALNSELQAVAAKRGPLFNQSHWDEPNVLAHVRFDDRTGTQGERVLHLAELQSDWHQIGRRVGYKGPDEEEFKKQIVARRNAGHTKYTEASDAMRAAIKQQYPLNATADEDIRRLSSPGSQMVFWERLGLEEPPLDVKGKVDRFFDAQREYKALLDETGAQLEALSGRVPDAPFKTTWPELAMKRMLRYAAEKGYDALSWDTGKTNADRYNLAKQIKSVRLHDNNSGGIGEAKLEGPFTGGTLMAHDHAGHQVIDKYIANEQELVDHIGKEAAERLLNATPTRGRSAGLGVRVRELKDQELEIGGEGMKAFYDKMLPVAVGKLVKKWGARVEQGRIGTPDTTVPKYDISRDGAKWVAYNPLDQYDYKEFATREEAQAFVAAGGHAERYVVGQDTDKEWRVIDTQGTQQFASGPHQDQEAAQGHARALNRREEEGKIPAHIVRITPALRDSVMGGQPMFLKRRKGSSGSAPAAPKRGAYDLARRAIAAIPNNEFVLSLRRIADPAGVSDPARATALVTREALGELARNSEEALQNLERYSKLFDVLGTQDRYDFIHSMETGVPQKNTELQPAADALRAILDDWRERIRGLGVGALDNFIENYFPHIWANDAKAKKVFGQIFGRRPLKGPASFLKERTIPTTREGLEAGLTPISTNPLVLAFAKLREMQRFYTGVKLMQRFKDEGLAKFLPSSKLRPDDWAEINDAVGRVRQWSETEQGFIERGKYIMPVDAARVINNHLGASALRNFLPAQIFRVLSNAANALQLGFSAFHLGFTTLDAVISKNALAIERLLHGEPLKAAQALLEASTGIGGAAMNIRRGSQLLKAYANLAGATPDMRRIVEGLEAAGGRIKMDNYYMAAKGLSPFKGVGFATLASDVKAALTQPRDKVHALTQTLTSFPQQYAMRLWRDLQQVWELEPLKILPIMSAIEIAGRMVRASTSIIMEHIVPLQKLGVFSDLASDHIRRNPLEDPVAFAGSMQKIWNSVDNRLGEMVYDNVFWNRTFKEVNHMLVRAVGWNLGTIRELGGAPIDVLKVLDYVARGAPAETESPSLGKTSQARLDYERQKSTLQRIAEKVGHKIPYSLALVATTMILGAVLTRLFTGKDPEDTKDYFFPPTGRLTKYGTPERISMPSYTKDLYEYGTQPMTTIINKANPIFGIMHGIYANEDFFGNAIRNVDDSAGKQVWDSIKYGARQVMPFSLQGTKQFVGAGEMDEKGQVLSTMPYIGFGPAPARVTSPEQMDAYQHQEDEKRYIKGLRMRIKQARERDDKQALGELTEELRHAMVKARETEAKIRASKMKAQQAQAKISSLVEGKSRPAAVAALNQAGLPAMARLWESMPDQPRPRVAEALEAFA